MHKLDTDKQVFFYEQEFYVLSNFSAFDLKWKGQTFYTLETAYHWEKFEGRPTIQMMVVAAPSAHEAFATAQFHKAHRRPDWDEVKVAIMRDLLRAKANQHEYVRRKLIQTGDRELIEDSWRDDFWGWGPNRDGRNMLGKLWMEIRQELVGKPTSAPVAMLAVASSNITSIGHDGKDLFVAFKNGGTYRYENVPVATFDKLRTAKSVGSYLHASIRGKFETVKLDGTAGK